MEGQGPFNSCDKWLFGDWFAPYRNAKHNRCTIDDNCWKYVFGCSSKEELIEYFGTDNIQKLLDHDYVIVSFLVAEEDCLFGDGEMALKRSRLPKSHPMYRIDPVEEMNWFSVPERKYDISIDMRLMA